MYKFFERTQLEELVSQYAEHNRMLAKEIKECRAELKRQEDVFNNSELKNTECTYYY